MPSIPSLAELLKCGVHFGHKEEKRHPKMQPYLFTLRNGVYVIDLEKTVVCMQKALTFITETVMKGGTALFIGTKPQAKHHVKAAAIRAGAPYVTERWLGGTLTNFSVIQKLVKKLESIEKKLQDPDVEAKYTKLERLMFDRERQRLDDAVGGIRTMKGLPQLIILGDVLFDETAVREAQRRNVPTIALCDSNVNPEVVTYPIPANDDASRSIEVIMQLCADAVLEGMQLRAQTQSASLAQAPDTSTSDDESSLSDKVSEDIVREAVKKAKLREGIDL